MKDALGDIWEFLGERSQELIVLSWDSYPETDCPWIALDEPQRAGIPHMILLCYLQYACAAGKISCKEWISTALEITKLYARMNNLITF